MEKSHGRFVELGENRYMALTDELYRRLQEVQAYGEITADGVRVHPLASFALEELADDIGGLKSDKLWKEHLSRSGQPDLPRPSFEELGLQHLLQLADLVADGSGRDVQFLGRQLEAHPPGGRFKDPECAERRQLPHDFLNR